MNFFKKNIIWILFIIFFLIRLPHLDQQFLLHDERDIVLSGYSIAKTARDLHGNFLPIRFENINPDNPLFSIYYSAFWWLFLPWKSVFFARLPFVFISSFLIIIVFKIIYEITKNKNLALITSIILCFSPWIFHITRLAMDVTLAYVTLLIAIYYYLKEKRFVSYLLFFITFYNYQGFRVLIPFLILYLDLFFLLEKKIRFSIKKSFAINLCFIIFLFSSIFFIDASITQKRFNQLVFYNRQKFTQEVDFKKNTSIASETLKKIANNKNTETIDYMLNNLLTGIDFKYLFKEGDHSPINSNAITGQFFFFCFIFYLLGFVYLGKISRIRYWLLVGFIPLGLLPSLISIVSISFSIRSIFSSIGFSYIIACGVLLFIKQIAKLNRWIIRIIIFSMLVIVSIHIFYFVYGYYYRRPILVSEVFFESERQLINYLQKNKKNKYILYHSNPRDILFSYIFANKNNYISSIQKINLQKPTINTNTLIIRRCDQRKTDTTKQKPIIIYEECLTQDEYIYFQNNLGKNITHTIPYKDISQRIAYFVIE